MIQGRGYVIPIESLSTGTSNGTRLIAIVAATDKTLAIGAVQGHFSNGNSSENVSFRLVRASASTPGTTITPRLMNPNSPAAGFTVSHSPTGVSLQPDAALATFGGNGAANYGWYPSLEEHQILLHPADILIVDLVIAPTSALTMQATINVTEL